MHVRHWYNWGTTCFLLKRTYAEKLINIHLSSEEEWQLISQIQTPFFDFSNTVSKDLHRCPWTEHIIYGSSCAVYTVLLLLDNFFNFGTSYVSTNRNIKEEDAKLASLGIGHTATCNFVHNWWRENKQHTLQDIIFKE
jgi:hypothetical protein